MANDHIWEHKLALLWKPTDRTGNQEITVKDSKYRRAACEYDELSVVQVCV